MKVLLINGSPNARGCTYTALREVADAIEEQGIETEILHIGADVPSCLDCGGCTGGRCMAYDDVVNVALAKAEKADGYVFGSPVHYAGASGAITSFLGRFFHSSPMAHSYKPASTVVSCRRAGSTAALDQLDKYVGYGNMMRVSSLYWHMVHGNTPDEVRQDLEGMQTMRMLGRNMAWVLKSIEAGRNAGVALPEQEVRQKTNFIR